MAQDTHFAEVARDTHFAEVARDTHFAEVAQDTHFAEVAQEITILAEVAQESSERFSTYKSRKPL